MRDSMVVMSIHPKHAEKILSGNKRIELRRSRPAFAPGTIVLIYSTAPVQQIQGFFIVDDIVESDPEGLWNDYSEFCGVTEQEYQAYFSNALRSYGLLVSEAFRFPNPISLKKIKKIYPDFYPPQSYRYIRSNQPSYKQLRKKCLKFT